MRGFTHLFILALQLGITYPFCHTPQIKMKKKTIKQLKEEMRKEQLEEERQKSLEELKDYYMNKESKPWFYVMGLVGLFGSLISSITLIVREHTTIKIIILLLGLTMYAFATIEHCKTEIKLKEKYPALFGEANK